MCTATYLQLIFNVMEIPKYEGSAVLASGDAVPLYGEHTVCLNVLHAHVLVCNLFTSNEVACAWLQGWQACMPWDTNPLYALMHESIYCHQGASHWAAHRIRQVCLVCKCSCQVA